MIKYLHAGIIFMILSVLTCTNALAAGFERPIPNAQSETTELWFALASLFLCIGLYIVHWVIKRR